MDLMDWFAQFSQVGYDEVGVCEYVPVTNYLRNYASENQGNTVDSFLALGELFQNFNIVAKIIEKGRHSLIIQTVLDFGVVSNFRDKLEAIKARVKAMEEEAEKLKKMQTEVDRQLSVPTSPTGSLNLSFEEKMEVDNRWGAKHLP